MASRRHGLDETLPMSYDRVSVPSWVNSVLPGGATGDAIRVRVAGLVTSVLAVTAVAVIGCGGGDTPTSTVTTHETHTTQPSPTILAPTQLTDTPAPRSSPATDAPQPASPTTVPGTKQAELGDSCGDTEHFIFAVSSTGQTLACRGETPRYVLSAPVIGVRTEGAPCTEEGLAQSPDGSPMLCLTRSGRQVWGVYLDY